MTPKKFKDGKINYGTVSKPPRKRTGGETEQEGKGTCTTIQTLPEVFLVPIISPCLFAARQRQSPSQGSRSKIRGTYTESKILSTSWLAELAEHRVYGVESRINLFSDLKVEENKRSADGFKPGPLYPKQRTSSNRKAVRHHPSGNHRMFIARVGLLDQQSDERVDNAWEKRSKKKITFAPVNTIFPDTKISSTTLGLIILQIRPGNN